MVRIQLAVVVGALGLAVAGCWNVDPAPVTPVTHHALAVNSSWVGRYACAIDDYPAFACEIRRASDQDGRLRLDKLGGSQRFRGVITPLANRLGFAFTGEYYCPWGACTQAMHGEFVDTGDGRLRGEFRDESVVVVLSRDPAALAALGVPAFGGASYGGAAYGGAAYGGAAYGGATYGGPR